MNRALRRHFDAEFDEFEGNWVCSWNDASEGPDGAGTTGPSGDGVGGNSGEGAGGLGDGYGVSGSDGYDPLGLVGGVHQDPNQDNDNNTGNIGDTSADDGPPGDPTGYGSTFGDDGSFGGGNSGGYGPEGPAATVDDGFFATPLGKAIKGIGKGILGEIMGKASIVGKTVVDPVISEVTGKPMTHTEALENMPVIGTIAKGGQALADMAEDMGIDVGLDPDQMGNEGVAASQGTDSNGIGGSDNGVAATTLGSGPTTTRPQMQPATRKSTFSNGGGFFG